MGTVDQRAHWNGPVGELWVREQARMDAQFAPFLQPVLDAARLGDAAVVLDVGCGCGALSLAAAGQGDRRRVVGIDISDPMLDRARDRAEEEGLADRLRFLHGDVQVMDVDHGPYDAVISRFGVMFFDDPVAAFRNMGRVTRPGGRLAFVCWAPQADNPWHLLPQEIAAAHVPRLEMGPSGSPGPFSLDDPERITTNLTAAGWKHIDIAGFAGDLSIGGGLGVAEAAVFVRGQRTLAAMLDGEPDAVVTAVVSDLERAFADRLANGVVTLPFSCWMVSALSD